LTILSPGHDLLIILAIAIIFRMWGRGIALTLKAYDYERPNTERAGEAVISSLRPTK